MKFACSSQDLEDFNRVCRYWKGPENVITSVLETYSAYNVPWGRVLRLSYATFMRQPNARNAHDFIHRFFYHLLIADEAERITLPRHLSESFRKVTTDCEAV